MSIIDKIKKFFAAKTPIQTVEEDTKEKCPNCGGHSFIFGPEGGGSQNVQCSSCYKYYNYMGPFGFHEIGDRSDIFGIKPNT